MHILNHSTTVKKMAASPLLKKKKIEDYGKLCIICSEDCNEIQKNPKPPDWERFKEVAEEWWRVRGKFSHVFKHVKWEAGHLGVLWHKDCKWKMMNKRSLDQAVRSFSAHSHSASYSSLSDESHNESTQHTTRQTTGTVHSTGSCVWCCKPYIKKNEDRDDWRTLHQMNVWYKFAASVKYVEDDSLRERLRVVVSSTTDPLAAKIRYHARCFKRYMRPVYEADPESDDGNIQNVNYEDVRQQFFRHVFEAIFEDGEVRTLKSLTQQYEQIRLNFGIISKIKSSHVKEMLIKEFGGQIGFEERDNVNQSTIVYNKSLTGTYLKSVVDLSGIKTAEILKAAAKRLREELKSKTPSMDFPPLLSKITDISDSYPNDALRIFLSQLIDDKDDKHASQIMFIGDAIESLVTSERTQLPTLTAIVVHGTTRSKELVDLLFDAGVSISYKSLLRLYDDWAYNDIVVNSVCPKEISKGKPGTVKASTTTILQTTA